MKAFIDSDVLIRHLRGEHKALSLLKKLHDKNKSSNCGPAPCSVRAEVVFFMRPVEEEATLLFLSQFQTVPVDQLIIGKAEKLYRQWPLRKGIDINDAILAATAMHAGGKTDTLNKKHYPMPDVVVQQAWRR